MRGGHAELLPKMTIYDFDRNVQLQSVTRYTNMPCTARFETKEYAGQLCSQPTADASPGFFLLVALAITGLIWVSFLCVDSAVLDDVMQAPCEVSTLAALRTNLKAATWA